MSDNLPLGSNTHKKETKQLDDNTSYEEYGSIPDEPAVAGRGNIDVFNSQTQPTRQDGVVSSRSSKPGECVV